MANEELFERAAVPSAVRKLMVSTLLGSLVTALYSLAGIFGIPYAATVAEVVLALCGLATLRQIMKQCEAGQNCG